MRKDESPTSTPNLSSTLFSSLVPVVAAILLIAAVMLSSRTKQVNAYGKRGRRIVDANTTVSANSSAVPSSGIISIFDDLPPPPQFKSLTSKMKKRENIVPQKSRTPPVKVVGLQKKKRLSPVLSPIHKKHLPRVAQIMAEELPHPKVSALKAKAKASTSEKPEVPVMPPASPRTPLSAMILNIPGSPSVSHDSLFMDSKTAYTNKPFAPFVDVSIAVLDDKGRTIRTERRVSQPKGHLRSPPSRRPDSRLKSKPLAVATSLISDSESEAENIPRARKSQHQRRKAIILSDESGSEDDTPPNAKGKRSKEVASTSKPSVLENKPIKRSKSIVEVIVPLAPYKLPRLQRSTQPPSPPPLPDDYAEVQDSPIPPPTPQPIPRLPAQRYHLIPSPPLKPRQLTPIKGLRKRFYEPPSPPSPATPTDFDLSIDFSDLSLGDGAYASSFQQEFEAPEYLLPLLEECSQETCGPHNFSAFIDSFPYDPILQSARENRVLDMQFRKIGEASYSEVFGIGDVVLKVIPIRDESKTVPSPEEDEGPAPSDAKDVRKEIIVTRAMGEVYNGFVKLLKTYVVKGKYPEMLLQLWDEYNDRKGSESVRPDTFKVSQIYAIIVLPNGGPDLEAYTFHNASKTGWRQACSLFWQVTKALAHAEHLVSFEHRDLHWGQILVKDLPTQSNALKPLNLNQKAKAKSRSWMDSSSHGVQATIIDLGLSRMDAGDGGNGARVHWTPFDEEVFMGEGDYQFDVYRMMRDFTGGAWHKFHPMTNVLWLHYLLQKLLYSKGLKPPSVRKTKASSESSLPSNSEGAFTEKDCYDCLLDLEEWLRKAVAGIASSKSVPTLKGKGRNKAQPRIQPSVSPGPARAGEIVVYGAKRGWIQATRLY